MEGETIHATKPLLNKLFVFYPICAYLASLYALCTYGSFTHWMGATLLLAHSLICSGYLHHELAHNLVFDDYFWNTLIGRINTAINGGYWWSFEDLKQMHFNHHRYKVDYEVMNKAKFWNSLPEWMRQAIIVCEYLYIPCYHMVLFCRAITAPWWKPERQQYQLRTLLIAASRVLLFATLAWFQWSALLGYVVAQCLFIQVLRLTDAYSHTYELVPVGSKTKPHGKVYDQERTFSIVDDGFTWRLVSFLLFLNFNYHNAHHWNTSIPWHQLPAVQSTLYKDFDRSAYEISLKDAFLHFHETRVECLLAMDPGAPSFDKKKNKLSFQGYPGVIDASFLILEL